MTKSFQGNSCRHLNAKPLQLRVTLLAVKIVLHQGDDVLSVSCPSAIEFSAILFLLLARSSSNSPQSLEDFRQTLVSN